MSIVAPPISDEAAPFWEATKARTFVLPWCADCGRAHWFPRAACPWCTGTAIEWRQATGDGVVHAATVHHRPGMGRTPDECPYVVALVDLPEGVRVLANVVDCDPDDVRVGDQVRLTWRPLDDGRHVVAFAPNTEAG